MITIEQEIGVEAPAETVFAVIVDLRGYGRWLTPSKAYAGTVEISSDPVTLGTTYVEDSPSGVRRGTVTELETPTRVAFQQPMTMKPALLGTIDITVRYVLAPTGTAAVTVHRVVALTLPAPLALVRPVVLRQFRTEGMRTLTALKAFAEGRH